MCVTSNDDWIVMEDSGSAGPYDAMTVEPPNLNVYVNPDLYAGVDWEEIHPPLLDQALAIAAPDITFEDLDLDLGDLAGLDEYLVLQGGELR